MANHKNISSGWIQLEAASKSHDVTHSGPELMITTLSLWLSSVWLWQARLHGSNILLFTFIWLVEGLSSSFFIIFMKMCLNIQEYSWPNLPNTRYVPHCLDLTSLSDSTRNVTYFGFLLKRCSYFYNRNHITYRKKKKNQKSYLQNNDAGKLSKNWLAIMWCFCHPTSK